MLGLKTGFVFMRFIKKHLHFLIFHVALLLPQFLCAQQNSSESVTKQIFCSGSEAELFATTNCFIENIGQYGDFYKGHSEMGKILFAYEGFELPVLFTEKGLIYLHQKIEKPKELYKEKFKNKISKHEEEADELRAQEKAIVMRWLNTSSVIEIVSEEKKEAYHTYGIVQGKAFAYARISYKNIYPGIDLVYSFLEDKKLGFKYSFVVQAGADASKIRMQFGGDVRQLTKTESGDLVVSSSIGKITQSELVSYYGTEVQKKLNSEGQLAIEFQINKREVSFQLPINYSQKNSFVIDPFISSTGNLIGANLGKAKDVDFDYAGNVYVAGGGDGNVHKLAKFNSAGVLQWTFTGTLAVPSWTFGPYYGGWVVEKSTGNVYLGNGFNPTTGYRVIRINTSGLYDNYLSIGNVSANENWKMFWSCNNGSPQILIAGGGTSGNLNLGILSPPATSITGINITGLTGIAQDVADLAYDPANFDIYTIYASLGGTPFVNNRIYKNTTPYSAASISWNVPSGFTSLSEANNRPYLAPVGTAFSDNSANILALNSSYLFYYDGRNLQAMSKLSGAVVGTPLNLAANTVLMQGGIEVDECNNVFIGTTNGTIKVFQFNGSTFNDAAAADITITGFTTKSVYDLVINDGQKLLYACGDGFVSSFDISSYGCGSAVYTNSVITDCSTHSATVSLTPSPPANSTITYVLYDGLVQLASNTTGVFFGLLPNKIYSVHSFVNQACSGTESVSNFSILGPLLSSTVSNTTCGLNAGQINASATGGAAPLQYSIDGVTYQSSGTFSGLFSGIYTLTVLDAGGCSSQTNVNLINSNGPLLSLTKTDASCGATTGTINALGNGGTPPYTYALNNGTYQSSNLFTNLLSGTYQVSIKDALNCINTNSIQINSIGNINITSVNVAATCGNNNGSITANVSGGIPPYKYSIDGVNFQTINVFTGLAPGAYNLTVKDNDNCINVISVSISNQAGPIISANATPSSCNSPSGTITITATGVAPLTYSINGGTSYQAGNSFLGLAAGTYTVLVKDGNNCLNSTNGIVALAVPQVTASTTASSCSINDGTITAFGTGGVLPYQYSIDGINFQPGTNFTSLGAGSYTLTIIDVNGCKNSITPVVVNNAAAMTISATATNTACTSPSGTITISSGGGQLPLLYSIDGLTYQSSPIFNNLPAAVYIVSVKDANSCIASTTLSIQKISSTSVSAISTSTSCNSSTGSITATALTGVSPFTYSINGINFFANNVFSSLSPGPYVVTIKDANQCTNTTNVLVSNVGSGSGPTVTATTLPAECGQANGRINGNGSGGNNPKQYSIDGVNWQGSTNFSNLLPGNYTLYVRDASGCINFTNVTIANILGPQVSATSTPSSCGNSNGTITATGFGGTPNYRYSVDGGINFQTSSTFSGLASGFYTVTVRDADNVCRNSIVVYIGNANGPSVSFLKTDATCGSNNGTVTVNGAGGTAPLNYSMDGVNYQTSNTFIGLPSGQYSLYVKDATTCSNQVSVTINNVAQPILNLSTVTATCGNSNASVSALGTSGTAPYQYSIDGLNFQNSPLFSGLNSGPITVTLKDANNCIVSSNVTLGNIDGPQLIASATEATCNQQNGKLILTGSGGTMPYTYSLDNISFQSSFIFSGLTSGPGNVYIKDANNCIASAAYTITDALSPSINAVDSTSFCGSNIKVTISGGLPPFQYSINSTPYQSSNIFPCLLHGTYFIKVLDANNCLDSIQFIIEEPLPIELISFIAVAEKNYNMLYWSTASERDNSFFTVERSSDGINFEIVGNIPGAGNSFATLNYSLKDEHPSIGINYYKLKQTCSDGDFHYSKIIAVNSRIEAPINYHYNQLDNELVLVKNDNQTSDVLELIDPLGRVIYSNYFQEKQLKIKTENFTNGLYILRINRKLEVLNYKFVVY